MKIGDTYWLTIFLLIETIFTVAAGIAFLRVPRIGQKDYWAVGVMICLAIMVQAISMIGAMIFHKNMNLVSNIYYFINLPVGIIFYQRRIDGFSKIAATTIIIIYLSIALGNLFFMQGISGINSYTYTISNIGFMCLTVAYYAQLFLQLSEHQAARGMFWINAAFLIYFSGTFFLTLIINYLLNFLHSDLITLWMVNSCLGFIMYSLLIYGLSKVRKEYLSHIISI